MEQYLIDTNVVSGYLSASYSAGGMDLLDSVVDAVPNLSVITQIELLCWNTEAATMQNVKSFIADSVVMDLNADVIAKCVTIRKGRKIKTPDAIIAATALANGFILITGNAKDFGNINGLKILNPNTL